MIRSRRTHGDAPVDVSLPITPMLDMSFQMLFYFVMTFQAANALEGELDLYLPKGGTPQAKQPDQVDLSKDSDADLESQADVTVEVSSQRGGIDGLSIREKARNTQIAGVKALRPALEKLRGELGGNVTRIKIQADGRLKYARLVDVMDACLGAGFKTVEFAQPPDLK
jgi:biopolymer transport protein ExbD